MAVYTVLGRRWFEKVNGNTYHSVRVFKDGELIGGEDQDYGYGGHYRQCAMGMIIQDDPTIFAGETRQPALWRIKEIGHKLIDDVVDVARKKDL